MHSRQGRLVLFVVAAVLIGGTIYVGRDMYRSSNSLMALRYVDAVSKAVAAYASSNGGLIPDNADLLRDLRERKLIADDLSETLTGINLRSVKRLGSAEYQIYLSCPDDERGRGTCTEILDAKTANGSVGVLRTTGRGTSHIRIDMQL